MELISVRKEDGAEGCVRVIGTVAYDDRPGSTDEYWFEFPSDVARSISDSGNAWLTCLVPLAASIGEPLRLPLPVDPLLVRNVRELVAIWQSWYPSLSAVSVVAPSESPAVAAAGRRTGAFFSGGVDSFFTLLHNEQPEAGSFPVDDLIAIHGFDLLLESEAAFERHRRRLERIAAETRKVLVPVRINSRETRLRDVPMGGLWHVCALASVGLLLESRYERLLVPGSDDYTILNPWGSHPLTDPLLSTSRTAVLHDGAAYTRWDKLEFLGDFDLALRELRVCSRKTSDGNCGECEKCYRNMIILDILGLLDRSVTFPSRRIEIDKVSRILILPGWHPMFYGNLRRFAAARGRVDIAKAIDRSIRRSKWRLRAVRLAARIGSRKLVWRIARRLKRWGLGDALR